MKSEIEIASVNVRGLRAQDKRQKIFNWFQKHQGANIFLLQETHSILSDELEWKEEWEGDIIFNHGESNSRGVCILFKKDCGYELHSVNKDTEGRYIILDLDLYEQRYTLVNLYGPNKDDPVFFMEIIKK